MMPQDVTMRWNSSFDMLNFALEYRLAIDAIIDEKEMKLRQYKLLDKDWKIVRQLYDVLKVCPSPSIPPIVVNLCCRSSKMQYCFSCRHNQILPVLFPQ